MDKAEALLRYKKMTDIIKYYEDADKYQWFNTDDPDLHPIRTKLPECPDWDKIDNFGLPKERQVFVREEMPSILDYLVKKVRLEVRRDKSLGSVQKQEDAFYDRVWEELESSVKYRKAIDWIERQWYYRLNGKWVFINGKPTYLAPNHWFYLNYWHIEQVGLPDYRERDREWFWAMHYFKHDTTVPKYDVIEEGSKKVKKYYYNDDGSLQLVDVGYRTVEGVIIAKSRRAGDTSKSSCELFCDTSIFIDANTGIQGDKEDTGEEVFNTKLMYGYKRLPFFWKPKSNHNIQSALIFESNNIDESVNSKIDYASASPTAYDGHKLYRYYADEPGKVDKYSIHERHSIVRLCLKLGTRIIGFSIYTTTVNDMSADAGINFEKLCRDSFFNERTDEGYTMSGMVVIHFPADHGCEGFVGKYGESVSGTPTEEQLKYIHNIKNSNGEYVGAREWIMMRREAFLMRGQQEEAAQEKRLRPLTFAESFAPPAQNTFFNMEILENRAIELKRRNDLTIRGDFVGDPNYSVQFVTNPDGRFIVSELPPNQMRNRKYSLNGVWYPQQTGRYIAGADPYRLEKTSGYQMSYGSFAVKRIHDPVVDPDNKPLEERETGLICCTYVNRPETIYEYNMDVLRACVFYETLLFPEMNIPSLANFFNEQNFGGYLLYGTDAKTGKPNTNPGFHSGNDMKKTLFNKTRDYIAMYGKIERHLEYINECLLIRGLEDMTNRDLFVSCAACHVGEESQYGTYLQEQPDIDIKDILGW